MRPAKVPGESSGDRPRRMPVNTGLDAVCGSCGGRVEEGLGRWLLSHGQPNGFVCKSTVQPCICTNRLVYFLLIGGGR